MSETSRCLEDIVRILEAAGWPKPDVPAERRRDGRWLYWVLVALATMLALSPIVCGQPPKVEATFRDGSRVFCTLQAESIDVTTSYGKLTVPVSEIHRIEFGRHYAPGVKDKIGSLAKQLGASAYKEREEAAALLSAYGPLAYHAVHETWKRGSPEAAKRAESILTAWLRTHTQAELELPE